MSSATTAMAVQYRLQEWAAQIRECQNRPAGMSVIDWRSGHGITKAKYYYRLRRVREACLESLAPEAPMQQLVPVNTCLATAGNIKRQRYAAGTFRSCKWFFHPRNGIHTNDIEFVAIPKCPIIISTAQPPRNAPVFSFENAS